MASPPLPPQFLPIEARWCLEAAAPTPAPPPCIQLEVARTPQQQSWGLMGRPPLAPLQGMWFPAEQPQVLKFWMHRTPAALDMLFLRDGRVMAIEAGAQPCPRLPCRSYGPDEPADGVIELAAGEAARLGIRVGAPARITALPLGLAAPFSGPAAPFSGPAAPSGGGHGH
ncbi:MAG: hypothetical protein RLZZ124_1616 [Cyanobacteriota bacterium]|jgi:uncharacterized membrane protein (UPF0127 family)